MSHATLDVKTLEIIKKYFKLFNYQKFYLYYKYYIQSYISEEKELESDYNH